MRELYAYNSDSGDTFGYIPRYSEFRYEQNRVAGDFRTTLNFWHAARIFASDPELDDDFIQMDSNEVERIFAVDSDDDHLWCHVLHKVIATRPMPKYGSPGGL